MGGTETSCQIAGVVTLLLLSSSAVVSWLGKQPIPLYVLRIISIKFPLIMLPAPSVDLLQALDLTNQFAVVFPFSAVCHVCRFCRGFVAFPAVAGHRQFVE